MLTIKELARDVTSGLTLPVNHVNVAGEPRPSGATTSTSVPAPLIGTPVLVRKNFLAKSFVLNQFAWVSSRASGLVACVLAPRLAPVALACTLLTAVLSMSYGLTSVK